MIVPAFKKFESLVKEKSGKWPYLPIALSLLVGTSLSVSASIMVWRWERISIQTQFERQADSLVHALQQNLDEYTQITRLLGGLYDASNEVDSQSFRLFSQNILPYHPGIQGIGWAKGVSILEKLEHFPIAYTEPKELKSILGYDLFSDSANRSAIQKARDTGLMIVTQYNLAQTSNSNPGFIIYRPVYKTNQQYSSPENLRQSFRGIVYTVFEIEDMVETSLKELELDRLNFFLYDTFLDQLQSSLMKPSLDPKESLLFSYQNGKIQAKEQLRSTNPLETIWGQKKPSCPYDWEWFTCLRTLNIAGKEWSILILPASDYVSQGWGGLSTLAIGLTATSTLVIYLWLSIKHTAESQLLLTALKQIVDTLDE